MGHERVLWEEGMFLGPQHFQAWERHLFHQLRGRVSALQPLAWGLAGVEVGRSLANGEFHLNSIAGVFRDGTWFDAPSTEPLPAMRKVPESFGTAGPASVFVAVREPRAGLMLSAEADAARIGRYRRAKLNVVDELRGVVEREVAVGHLDLRILFEGESLDGYQTLEVARLQKSDSGYRVDPEHIPTCVTAAASTVLRDLLGRIKDMWVSKSAALTQSRTEQQAGTIQFSATEAANYWLLHTINTALPVIAHHARQPDAHPEVIYRVLASMAGSLCTYHTDRLAARVPPYEHADLTGTFKALSDWLRVLPEVVLPDSCIPIPMATVRDVFLGEVPDSVPKLAEIYLGIKCDAQLDRVVTLPRFAKIGSPDRVERCRQAAVSGIDMVHEPAPTSDIRRTAGYQYFLLNRQSRYWDEMRQAGRLCVFVPPEFRNVQIECMAVKRVAPSRP